MSFNSMPSPEVIAQIERNGRNQRLSNEIAISNSAPEIAKKIYEEAVSFQRNLSPEYDVAFQLVQFGMSVLVYVNNIGYIGHSLIVFSGIDTDGNPIELIQHTSQLNFLLIAEKHEVVLPKIQIGFQG